MPLIIVTAPTGLHNTAIRLSTFRLSIADTILKDSSVKIRED